MADSTWIAALAGIVCGVLSGMGIGGGTLLMVWMTAVAGMEQAGARGINLLYFLPVATVSLFFHGKNGLLSKKVILPAAAIGCVTAALTGYLAWNLDMRLLGKLFGGFLLLVGGKELFYRDKKAK